MDYEDGDRAGALGLFGRKLQTQPTKPALVQVRAGLLQRVRPYNASHP
jgi:hypothetical protein